MAKYTVRKIKKFLGHEGHGFNAELMRDGEPVSFVIDEGNGGCANFEWYDREQVQATVRTDDGTEKQIMLLKGQAELREHIKGQTRTFDGITFDLDEGTFVGELTESHFNHLRDRPLVIPRDYFRLVACLIGNPRTEER